MILNDPDLAEIVKEGTPVEINSKQYQVIRQRSGSCEGCAFQQLNRCPDLARQYCCSNGGNILKLVKQNNK